MSTADAFTKYLAESSSEGATKHTCTSSLDRLKSATADYKSIIAAGKPYTDTSFPQSEAISWSDMKFAEKDEAYMKDISKVVWKRASEISPKAVLFKAGDGLIRLQG